MTLRHLFSATGAALLLATTFLHAQTTPQPPAAGSRTPRPQAGAGGQVRVPKVDREPSLNDFADMKADDWAREHMAAAGDFVQNSPFDGKPATERTEAWLGRSDTTFYAVFICFDTKASMIRGHLARRENIDADDSVGVLLDPFQDRRHGVLFQVNPAGVQEDASWEEPNNSDTSYDQVWDSTARRTPQGWIATFAIPLRSVRSRAASTTWGVVLQRNLPRNSETDYWPNVTQSISGILTQEGTLLGMEGATSHNIQINPYGIAHRIRQLNDDDPNNPFFSNRNLGGTAGGDVKAVIRDTVVVDGTFNPDFSQIESDQPQFRINQRFAVYYPELRPFFLENASYFDAPITMLYTRTVNNPEYGVRVTGKLHNTDIGFLAVDDRGPGEYVAPTDPLHGKRAITTVARLQQEFGKASSLGLMYSQRTLDGKSNRVGGADFSWQIDQHWSMNGMAVASSTQQQDGTYSAGPAEVLRLQRSGHSFYFQERYRDFSQGFETDTGFINVPQVRQSNTQANYQWYPTGSWAKRLHIQSYGWENNLQIAFNRLGQRTFHYGTDDVFVTLAHNTVLAPIYVGNSDTLGPTDFAALTRRTNFTENKAGFVFRSAPIPQITANIQAYYGATVNYNPAGNAAPTLLHDDTVNALVTLQPIAALTVDNTYLLDRANDAHTGIHVYESQTLRTKINYQFTRSFSLRTIVEYDTVAPNPAWSSLARTKQLAAQVLFTWLPHPGTAIYAGYNDDLQNLDRNLCTRLGTGQCDSNYPIEPRSPSYLQDGREFFVKASYLLRF